MPETTDRAPEPGFRVETDQNRFLPIGGRMAPVDAATRVALRPWTPRNSVVRHVRQVAPGGPGRQLRAGRIRAVLTGTVRIRPGVARVDATTLDTNSTRTARTRPRKNGPDTGGAPVPG